MYNTNVIIAIMTSVGIFTGAMVAAISVQSNWRLDAAKTECAQFNPTHGQFEWLSEGVHENANLR